VWWQADILHGSLVALRIDWLTAREFHDGSKGDAPFTTEAGCTTAADLLKPKERSRKNIWKKEE
jgi:hypothetical protein